MPSSSQMIALLGLLAVAGYQNRDRLGALVGRITGQDKNDARTPGGQETSPGGEARGSAAGGFFDGLGGLFGGGLAGGGIAGGLGELIDRFTGNGQGDVAKSWVETGPNREPTVTELEQALGSDAIEALTQQTGLSRTELLARLRTVLPTAVDKMTPDGRLPTESEASRWAARGT